MSSLAWEGFAGAATIATYENRLASGEYYWARWPERFPNNKLFHDSELPTYTDPVQGGAENGYIIAAMAAAAEFPALIQEAFVTQTDNHAGIYGIRFFIRGKPWVVDVDDYLLFNSPTHPVAPQLQFAQPEATYGTMWAPILEKAWAKVKGSYENTHEGLVCC